MDYVKERTHIIDHERFLEAGAIARDLWEWGMKYSGKHELDGALPMAAVLASPWGYGGKANMKAAIKLVEVGLWDRTERGFHIRKWTEQGNKTHAELEEKRTQWAKKKKTQRSDSDLPKSKCPPGTPSGTPEGTLARVLNSTSYSSGSSLGEEIKIPEASPSARASTEPPAWFGEALATVEDSTGEKLRPPDSWLRYSGHRGNKGIPKTQQDAVYWLTTVMVPEARKERRELSDKREREAKWDKQRAGPGSLNEPQKPMSREQAQAEAKRFGDMLKAQTAKRSA